MKLFTSVVTAIAASLLFTGCSSSVKSSLSKSSTSKSVVKPYYAAHLKDARYYVIGSEESEAKFKATHHLPYTDTRIGVGPKGESVIVEVDKKDPKLQERLWNTFSAKNLYYSEIEYDARTYIVGSIASKFKFMKLPHFPYAKTLVGAGAQGQTVVVEIDKKNSHMQERLWKEYKARNFYYAEEIHDGRIYVIGNKETHEKFKKNPHLPYPRTMIGAGPDGETIIFELDKKNPVILRSAMLEFNQRYGTRL